MIHTRPEMMHSRPEVIHAHQTAPTQFVEANGIRFAYRRFGKSGGVPLLLSQRSFQQKANRYNDDNCLTARDLFQQQPGVRTNFWCEKRRFRP
jgi:hypothetical protein